MANNFIDTGALQGATKQDVGAMQSSGAATVNETITVGVLAHVAPTCTATEVGSVALGVGAHTGQAAPVEAIASVEADVTVGTSAAGAQMLHQAIVDGVLVGVTPAAQAGVKGAIALGVRLGVAFVDEEIFAQTRRGKSAVTVSPGGSGKATVR